MNNKLFFLISLLCASLLTVLKAMVPISQSDGYQVFQLTVTSQGKISTDAQNCAVLGQAIDSVVQKKEAILREQFEEQEEVNLLRKDLEWVHDVYSLLSVQDQKDYGMSEVRLYVSYISEKKKLWSEFYPGSLEKAKNRLKEKIKETLNKAYNYEPLITNYTSDMQKKDAQIAQLEKDKKYLEDRLEKSFVVRKTMVKQFGFILFVVGIVMWTVRFLYQKKCSAC